MAGENNIIGLAMQLDVTDLKAGIKEVNQVIKSSKDEFNHATAGMDKWTESSEGLNAKLKQLGTQLEGQKKITAGYEAEIERVKNLEGDHSAELETLKGKLLNAQTAVKKTQSAMSHYEDTLSELTQKEKEENSTLGKLQKTLTDQKKKQEELTKEYKNAVLQYGKNSREAQVLKTKLQALNGELDDTEGQLKDADKAAENLGKTFNDTVNAGLGKSLKVFAKVGAGVAGLVGSFLATAEATRELRTNVGKVDTAFSEAGFSAEQAEDTYTKFYGILGDEGQATEAVSHLAKLSKSQEDLSKWTDIAAGVYGTFGDSLPIENLTEAANETAKTGQLTGGLADALNWAGISEDKFQDKLDACTTEQERQALIQDTLTKAYSGASAKYKETNADIIAGQEAQARLSQAMADVGAQAEPLMTSLKTIGAELLEKVAPALEKLIPFIQDHLPALAVVLGTVTAAFGAMGAAVLAVKIKQAALTTATVAHTVATKAQEVATKGLTLAQKALNVVLKANPIGIVITVVLALVAAFVTLWKKSDAFREFWIKLWDKIKSVSKTCIDAIAKFFSSCWDGIKKVWGKASGWFKGVYKDITNAFKSIPKTLKEFFSKAWDGIKKVFGKVTSFFKGVASDVSAGFKSIPEKLKSVFSTAWDKIKTAFNNVGKFFSGIAGDVVDGFKSLPDKMKSVGKNLIEGLWNGVNNMASWISGKLKGFSDNVLSGIKKFFKVNSPSKATEEIGEYVGEGLGVGIENASAGVVDAATKVGAKVGESLTNGVNSGFKSFDSLTGKIDKQKQKLKLLESEYKNAVMTFGETSTEAYSVAKQIFSLSGEIEANEKSVNALNISYENLNATLAKQMQVELNNKKQIAAATEERIAQLIKLEAETRKAGAEYDANDILQTISTLKLELTSTNKEITTLTSNIDLLNKKQTQSVEQAEQTTVAEITKSKNAYELLTETIKNQKDQLEKLKGEYESLMLGGDEANASNLAVQIKVLSEVITDNEDKVKSLDAAYDKLFTKVEKKVENVVPDTRKGWQKFIDKIEDVLGLSDDKMEKWSEGTGKYIYKIADAFDGVTGQIGSMFESVTDLIDQSVDAQVSALDTKLESAKKAADEEMKKINKMYDNQEISAEEYYDKKKKLEAEAQKQEQKLLKEKDKLARKQFESQKATSIAQATINGASAIIKGFAELGPIAGAINAISQGAITAAQIAAIAAQKYVPMLAKGGVVNGATLAMIGENGKEAVMPLENNTGWIKELAQKLNDVMRRDMLGGLSSGVPAYAMAGKTTINNNYNQTINSPKSLTRREIYRDSKNLLALKG